MRAARKLMFGGHRLRQFHCFAAVSSIASAQWPQSTGNLCIKVVVIARSASDEAIQNPDISKNRPFQQALMLIMPHACLNCFAPLAMTAGGYAKVSKGSGACSSCHLPDGQNPKKTRSFFRERALIAALETTGVRLR